ncbi:MAG: AAA family ATPase, partial [SAR202 cluster bacterium]|nr:AAA family ATPase [SAR202 cluster bacterium]
MRLLRLRLANYRGIDESEVQFGPNGLTIVEGPNETGKTSLSESIGLLFDYPDSSKHRSVDAIRPVHHDAGPEIELEAESGPYRFTYFKRFYKKLETTLTITRPNSQNYTGREAYERATEILRETIDIALW